MTVILIGQSGRQSKEAVDYLNKVLPVGTLVTHLSVSSDSLLVGESMNIRESRMDERVRIEPKKMHEPCDHIRVPIGSGIRIPVARLAHGGVHQEPFIEGFENWIRITFPFYFLRDMSRVDWATHTIIKK